MRFRAKISHDKLAFVWSHLASLDKVGKEVVLLLSAESMRISVFPQGEAVMQYTCIPTGPEVFDEFRVESQTNVIALQMQVENIQKAMRAGLDSAEQIIFKLTKRGASPFLLLEFREASAGIGGGGSTTTQEIPVKVLSAMETAHYDEPRIGATVARLFLPTASKMSAVLDRMKGVAKYVWITVDPGSRVDENKKASLSLSVGSEAVSMQTLFPNLPVALGGGADENEEEEEEDDGNGKRARRGAKLLVGTRDLSRVVKAIAMHPLPSTWLLCVLAEALVLNCAFEDGSGTTTYILAATDSEMGTGGAVPVSENLGQDVSVEDNEGGERTSGRGREREGGRGGEDEEEEMNDDDGNVDDYYNGDEFPRGRSNTSNILQNESRLSMTGAGGGGGGGFTSSERPGGGRSSNRGRPSLGESVVNDGTSRLSVTHGDLEEENEDGGGGGGGEGGGDSRLSRSDLGISIEKSAVKSRPKKK
jgi:hypothetical protein